MLRHYVDDENVKQASILDKRQQGKMHTESFKDIIQVSSKMPTSVGFVGACALLCYNRRLLQKAKEFVLDPCGVLRKDLTLLMKSKIEEERQKFCTLVYAALNGGNTGCFIIYDTITKCNNFSYLQQIIFIYVLNCS